MADEVAAERARRRGWVGVAARCILPAAVGLCCGVLAVVRRCQPSSDVEGHEETRHRERQQVVGVELLCVEELRTGHEPHRAQRHRQHHPRRWQHQ